MRLISKAAAAGAVAATLVLGALVPAAAVAAPDNVEEIAALSESVNPDQAPNVDFDAAGVSSAQASTGERIITIDGDGDTSVMFSTAQGASPYLEVTIDQSGTALPVEVSDEGLAVAIADSTVPDVVVSASEAGTSIQAALESPESGDSVEFEFANAQLRVLEKRGRRGISR